jgi:hypothetical protein
MNKSDEYMAVVTPGGDVIRRRANVSVVGYRGLRDPIEHRTPALEDNELLVERIGNIPMIIKAHA